MVCASRACSACALCWRLLATTAQTASCHRMPPPSACHPLPSPHAFALRLVDQLPLADTHSSGRVARRLHALHACKRGGRRVWGHLHLGTGGGFGPKLVVHAITKHVVAGLGRTGGGSHTDIQQTPLHTHTRAHRHTLKRHTQHTGSTGTQAHTLRHTHTRTHRHRQRHTGTHSETHTDRGMHARAHTGTQTHTHPAAPSPCTYPPPPTHLLSCQVIQEQAAHALQQPSHQGP